MQVWRHAGRYAAACLLRHCALRDRDPVNTVRVEIKLLKSPRWASAANAVKICFRRDGLLIVANRWRSSPSGTDTGGDLIVGGKLVTRFQMFNSRLCVEYMWKIDFIFNARKRQNFAISLSLCN